MCGEQYRSFRNRQQGDNGNVEYTYHQVRFMTPPKGSSLAISH
jgi:hypothetical protein